MEKLREMSGTPEQMINNPTDLQAEKKRNSLENQPIAETESSKKKDSLYITLSG